MKDTRFTPGTLRSIPADFFNELQAMLRWFHTQQAGISGDKTQGPPSSSIIKVKNNSGGDVARYGVLGLGDPIFTPSASLTAFKNDATFLGETPAAAHAGKFCVLLEPLKNGKVGPAVVSGVVQVQVEVASELTNLAFTFADITVGDTTKLTAGYSGGAGIDYKVSGTGTQWALVNLGPREQRVFKWAKFKETGTWAIDTSLTVDLCDESRASLSTDITAWNYFVDGIEKDTSKKLLLMGSGPKLVVIAVDPCA